MTMNRFYALELPGKVIAGVGAAAAASLCCTAACRKVYCVFPGRQLPLSDFAESAIYGGKPVRGKIPLDTGKKEMSKWRGFWISRG